MIFKRKSSEERFAEELAKELEAQAKQLAKRMTQEQLRDIKVMKKNSPAVALIEKRIERGEIKLYWRNVEGELHIATRETFHNFPFKRHRDYLLLPSGLEAYFTYIAPISLDWVQTIAETWRPRALATVKWLEEPVKNTGYDGYYEAAYHCIVEARDGRRFLAAALECMLLEEANGAQTGHDVASKAAARYASFLWKRRLKREVEDGRRSREEAQKMLNRLPQFAFTGLAILKDLGLVV